jgi:8-oxo-dGTP diphosphatase
MSKTLILIRHAHRDTSQRELDNGLSEKGREQAKSIRRFFTSRFENAGAKDGLWLVSSPKLRCVETLTPLAKSLDRSVDIHPLLDEGAAREGGRAIEARTQAFLQEWKQSKVALTVLCSHGDILPIVVHQLLGLQIDPKKGSWIEIEWELEQPMLKWYIPTFKHFYVS